MTTLTGATKSAKTTTNTAADSQELISTLLAEFRQIVVEIDEENRELKEKLRGIYSPQELETLRINSRHKFKTQLNPSASKQPILRGRQQSSGSSKATVSSSGGNGNTNAYSNGKTAHFQINVTNDSTTNKSTSPETLESNNHNQTEPSAADSTGSSSNTRPPPYKAVIEKAEKCTQFPTPKSEARTTNVPSDFERARSIINNILHKRHTISGGQTAAPKSTKHNNTISHISEPIPQAPIRRRRRATLQHQLISLLDNDGDVRKTNTTMAVQRGALIVLEGLDRVGKSTLAKKLVEHLERIQKPVDYHRFPNRSTPIGQLIDDLLRNSSKHIDDHAMHLLFSANRWELNKQMRQKLMKGTTIVVDRYSYSGVAYSCAKRDLALEWCREVENGLPKPDLVIYLELAKESQYKRPGFGDERFEVGEFQELIGKEYEKIIKASSENWLRIDVEDKGPEQVLSEVVIPVQKCIETCSSQPLGDLKFK